MYKDAYEVFESMQYCMVNININTCMIFAHITLKYFTVSLIYSWIFYGIEYHDLLDIIFLGFLLIQVPTNVFKI